MTGPVNISIENRYLRHGIFWAAWVFGFTFVKSFGSGMDVYAGWLAYYLVTLPIFILHTYLVVYWAASRFLKGYYIILFVLLFIFLMTLFSFIEMVITSGIMSKLFPGVFSHDFSKFDPGKVFVSGIGNIYIILVFAATKMIRTWYISDKKKQQIISRNLFLERADANAEILPGMLLYSISSIERLSSDSAEKVPAAIVLLSEILKSVMQSRKSPVIRMEEELKNVRKLLQLYGIFLAKSHPGVRMEDNGPGPQEIPGCMVFSPIEIMCRQAGQFPADKLVVSRSSRNVTEISWSRKNGLFIDDPGMIIDEMEQLYPGRFTIRLNHSEHSDTLLILENQV
ncbi:MAG: hypothetical protein WD052_13835 [Bacteroidales bacterium]